MGILDVYVRLSDPTYHFWGLPLTRTRKEPGDILTATANFADQLCWEHVLDLESPSDYRRHAFPSWSWTGWALTARNTVYRPTPDTDLELWAERRDGALVDWETFQKGIGKDATVSSTEMSRYLLLKTLTVEVQLRYCPQNPNPLYPDEGPGLYIDSPLKTGGDPKYAHYFRVQLPKGSSNGGLFLEKSRSVSWRCVVLRRRSYYTGLIFLESMGYYFERVGIAIVRPEFLNGLTLIQDTIRLG